MFLSVVSLAANADGITSPVIIMTVNNVANTLFFMVSLLTFLSAPYSPPPGSGGEYGTDCGFSQLYLMSQFSNETGPEVCFMG